MAKRIAGRRGFTLTELLAVVAVTAVLAVLAMAAYASLKKGSEYSRLCSNAKEIFLAAQNNLTRMHSSGTLTELRQLGADGGSHPVPSSGNAGFPYPESAGQYFYTTSAAGDKTAFGLVLPEGSVEKTLRENRVFLEYNPTTGSVYAVFYSESSAELTYSALSREESVCAEKKLGYYHGSVSVGTSVQGTAFAGGVPAPESALPRVFRKEAGAA